MVSEIIKIQKDPSVVAASEEKLVGDPKKNQESSSATISPDGEGKKQGDSTDSNPTNTTTSVTEEEDDDEVEPQDSPKARNSVASQAPYSNTSSASHVAAAPTSAVLYGYPEGNSSAGRGSTVMAGAMAYYAGTAEAEPSTPTIPTKSEFVTAGTTKYPFPSTNNKEPSPLSPPRGTVVTTSRDGKNSNNNVSAAMAATAGSGNYPPPTPASPLFPRYVQNANNNHITMASSPVVVYPSPYSNPVRGSGTEEDSAGSWMAADHRSSQMGAASPQVNSQGMPLVSYGGITTHTRSGRAYSFEESMLPLPAGGASDGVANGRLPQELINPAYSPYGGSTASSVTGGGTLFAHQWPYSGPPPDIYGTAPLSPLQPRPSAHMPPPLPHHPGSAAAVAMGYPPHPSLGMRPMPQQAQGTSGHHAQYGGGGGVGGPSHHQPGSPLSGPFVVAQGGFPTSSPGPPIQTTASNKGPDGANLFIFHIPNHFTNLDMYQLFEPYGNLLSVRIMVERDTGRSRGFGFVSYDSPESAALAIKALNGFAIGNKRLKVQHKQIRPRDMHERDQEAPNEYGPGDCVQQQQYANFPVVPSSSSWYSNDRMTDQSQSKLQQQTDELTDLTSSATSTTVDAESSLTMGNSKNNGVSDSASISPLVNLGSLHAALPDTNNNSNNTSTMIESNQGNNNDVNPHLSQTEG